MKTRLKEILVERGLTMKDLAEEMGVDGSNLAKSVANNPKVSTLQKVADALHIGLTELISKPEEDVDGQVIINGEVYVLRRNEKAFSLPVIHGYDNLKSRIKEFISQCVKHPDEEIGLMAMFGISVCFSLIYHKGYFIVLVNSSRKGINSMKRGRPEAMPFTKDVIEYRNPDDTYDIEALTLDLTEEIAEPSRY